MRGRKASQRLRYTYDLYDEYDRATQTTSMARTTGYTCAIVVRQVAAGLFARRGICPPEYIGAVQPCYEHLLAGYAQRHIRVTETIEPV